MEELDPWLIPETQRSGFLSRISFTASLTQSAGVPEQLYSKYSIKVMPGKFLTYDNINNNPGQDYVRIALVHKEKKNNDGLNKIAKLLL